MGLICKLEKDVPFFHVTKIKTTYLLTYLLILTILAQSYLIITDGFCGYLSNLSLISQSLSHSVTRNLDLRDASESKN